MSHVNRRRRQFVFNVMPPFTIISARPNGPPVSAAVCPVRLLLCASHRITSCPYRDIKCPSASADTLTSSSSAPHTHPHKKKLRPLSSSILIPHVCEQQAIPSGARERGAVATIKNGYIVQGTHTHAHTRITHGPMSYTYIFMRPNRVSVCASARACPFTLDINQRPAATLARSLVALRTLRLGPNHLCAGPPPLDDAAFGRWVCVFVEWVPVRCDARTHMQTGLE